MVAAVEELRVVIARAIWNTYSGGEDWVPWDEMEAVGLPQEILLAEADAVVEELTEAGVQLVRE